MSTTRRCTEMARESLSLPARETRRMLSRRSTTPSSSRTRERLRTSLLLKTSPADQVVGPGPDPDPETPGPVPGPLTGPGPTAGAPREGGPTPGLKAAHHASSLTDISLFLVLMLRTTHFFKERIVGGLPFLPSTLPPLFAYISHIIIY